MPSVIDPSTKVSTAMAPSWGKYAIVAKHLELEKSDAKNVKAKNNANRIILNSFFVSVF
jgi:hypothetical protein